MSKNGRILVGLALVIMPLNRAAAQGSLTPPGAPTPTMKTLDQVEPRIPINDLPYSITNRGSYFLAASITGGELDNGIEIAADNVTLDLMGFTLQGGGGSDGVYVSGAQRNVIIRNGIVSGWANGVRTEEGSNCRVEGIIAVSNSNCGISVGAASVAERCTADANLGGFQVAGANSILRNCLAQRNMASGIEASSGALVENCESFSNAYHGITCGADCLIRGNRCIGNGHDSGSGSGITTSGDRNRIENNEISHGYRGLDVQTYANLVSDNVVEYNLDNYSLADYTASNSYRLLISDWPVTINGAGTYAKVTRDLSNIGGANGITVEGRDVTIDLNGHTLNGIGTSGCGIYIDPLLGGGPLTVLNGKLTYWNSDGMSAIEAQAQNTVVHDVVIDNSYHGIRAGMNARLRNCVIYAGGDDADSILAGNDSLVENCRITSSVGDGISVADNSQVKSCTVLMAGSIAGTGIQTGDRGMVLDCIVDNVGTGIVVGAQSTVERCAVSRHITGEGISCLGESVVRDNRVTDGGSDDFTVDGIHARGDGSLFTGNIVLRHNGYGFNSHQSRSAIFQNIASSNLMGNWDVILTDGIAPFSTPASSSNAWANLSYGP